jgi:hypothetical protein
LVLCSGWCGTTADHCSEGIDASATAEPEEKDPTSSPTQAPFESSKEGTCGGGDRGDGICADGTCCSKFGKVFLDIVILIA